MGSVSKLKSPARLHPRRRPMGISALDSSTSRAPHITLKMIANNAEIDVIWEKYQMLLEPLRLRLNDASRHVV